MNRIHPPMADYQDYLNELEVHNPKFYKKVMEARQYLSECYAEGYLAEDIIEDILNLPEDEMIAETHKLMNYGDYMANLAKEQDEK